MHSALCILATLAALITLPIVLILWATESPAQRAKRWRSYGHTQQRIADRLGVSRSTVRRMIGTLA